MAGNIRIYDDEDELDAEEDGREPVDGDPVVNDDEDEEDALYMLSIYTWDGGRGERMNLMLDAEEDERELVDGDAVSDDKDEEDAPLKVAYLHYGQDCLTLNLLREECFDTDIFDDKIWEFYSTVKFRRSVGHCWYLNYVSPANHAEIPHEKIGVVDAQSIERKVLPSYEISYNVLTSFTRMDLWFLFLAWMLPDDAKSFWGFLAVEILPIGYCTLLFSSTFLMSSTAVTTRARSCSVPEHTTDSFAVISCWRHDDLSPHILPHEHNVNEQEELKEWDQCLLMLGDAKVDEHGNVNITKDCSVMYLDKDGEDREINISSAICFLRGKAYEALENRAQARQWYKAAVKADPLCYEALERLIENHMLTYEEGFDTTGLIASLLRAHYAHDPIIPVASRYLQGLLRSERREEVAGVDTMSNEDDIFFPIDSMSNALSHIKV
ncbi:hypothetical protein RHGRI_017590 [Rhododendron griersonianum]|uniref:Uncharacterized protein n=1 Tax=Rhododendron griersonianum TaxID=479676 RepID=A0AAV6JYL3_9ERIC|nr:hypothetical protein RHGRI_017590 [Rhododendron griersonianum]